MAEYAFMYKCRLCGKLYPGERTGNEELAQYVLLTAVFGGPTIDIIGPKPKMVNTHPGCRGGYGVSDLAGYFKLEDTN